MWQFAKCLNPLLDFSLLEPFFLTRKQVMVNIMTLFILQFTFLWSLFVATDLSYLAQRGNPKDKLFWRLVNWINVMFLKKTLKRRIDFLESVNLGLFQENNNSMQFPKCLSLSEHYVTLWKIWKRVITVWKLRKFSNITFCTNFVKLTQLVQQNYSVWWFHEIFSSKDKIQNNFLSSLFAKIPWN